MFSSFIFDKDGVLVDTEEAKIRSYYQVLTENVPHEIPDWEEYSNWHKATLTGKSRDEVVKGIIQEYPSLNTVLLESRETLKKKWKSHDFDVPRYEEVKKEIEEGCDEHGSFDTVPPDLILSIHRLIKYADIPLPEKCKPIAPMLKFLKSLQERNVFTALVTDTTLERTRKELSHIGVAVNSFEIVVCNDKSYSKGEEWETPGDKSKITMYSAVKEKFSTEADEKYNFVAIEDTDPGMEAALKAEIPCFMPWEGSYNDEGKVASFLEALEIPDKSPASLFIVAIDFGGERTKVGFGERLLLYLPYSFGDKKSEEIVDFLKKMCESPQVRALGISLASTFVPVKGKRERRIWEYSSKFKILSEIDNGYISEIRAFWKKEVKVPVFILNDGEAAALAEHRRGGGRDRNHILVVTLGTSIGVGFIFHGEVLVGPYSSRASHIILDPQGEWCRGDSHRGCWRSFARMEAVKKLAEDMGYEHPDLREIAKKAREKNRKAQFFYELYAERIAKGIATIVGAVPVECVVVGGGIAQAGSVLFDPLRERLLRGDLLMNAVAQGLEIVPAQCTEASLLGAFLYAEEMMEKTDV